MQLCSFCKTSSCDLVINVWGQLFLFILFPLNKSQHQLQESQVTCHCELLSKDQPSWDKLAVNVYVVGGIPWFCVLKLGIWISPRPWKEIRLPLLLTDLWNCPQVSGFPFSSPESEQAETVLDLTPRLINIEVLLSWVRWLFVVIMFELKQIKTHVSFVQLRNKGIINVFLLTLIPDNANKGQWHHACVSSMQARGRRFDVQFPWSLTALP